MQCLLVLLVTPIPNSSVTSQGQRRTEEICRLFFPTDTRGPRYPQHRLPAGIYDFFGEKKNIEVFIFPPPRNKTSHVLNCSINLAIH